MGIALTAYSTKVSLPLPTDEPVGPEMMEDLLAGHDPNVVRMLLGTADMFPGAKAMVQAVFRARDVEPRLRELIILRSAYLVNCPYDWQANVVMATNARCTQGEIEAMTTDGVVKNLGPGTDVVMLATDELTRTGTLTDDEPGQLRDNLADDSCRKLVLIIAWFNLLACDLNGCRVPLETDDKIGGRTSPIA